jgi:hypothetical protein
MMADGRERGLGGSDGCVRTSPREIAAAEELEIAKLARAVEAAAGATRIAEQIEVVTNEEHHAIAHETLEEVCAELVVIASVDRFSHVVEEGGGPELGVFGSGERVFEDLKRVEERVALGMVARGLGHAIEVVQEVEEFGVHLLYGAATPTRVR